MTKHSKLSSLLIAVTATFIAAVPCFAQTQSDEPRTDVSSAPAISVVESAMALNREIPRKRIDVATPSVERPRLSADMFVSTGDRFTNSSGDGFTAPSAFVYEPIGETSTKQFRAERDPEHVSRPRVTFVPSRGPKLPS